MEDVVLTDEQRQKLTHICLPGATPQIFKLAFEGEPGEFHCMKCYRICNYIKDCYCCDDARTKDKQSQKGDSYLLAMCFIQDFLNKLVDALCSDSMIVNEKGACLFCRNQKQHDDKWCLKQTLSGLYKHIYNKQYRKHQMILENWLDMQKNIRVGVLRDNLNKITNQLEHLIDQEPANSKMKCNLINHKSGVRHSIRNEEKYMDDDNNETRERYNKYIEDINEKATDRLMKWERGCVMASCFSTYFNPTSNPTFYKL